MAHLYALLSNIIDVIYIQQLTELILVSIQNMGI